MRKIYLTTLFMAALAVMMVKVGWTQTITGTITFNNASNDASITCTKLDWTDATILSATFQVTNQSGNTNSTYNFQYTYPSYGTVTAPNGTSIRVVTYKHSRHHVLRSAA